MVAVNGARTAGGVDVVGRIRRHNAGRDPERLQLKFQQMRADLFAYFRGTCHLFYEDWDKSTPLDNAPLAWLCGDLHPENFGTYRGDNRLTYFDINDFDEAVLAPCTWDLARFVAAVLVAARTFKLWDGLAYRLCICFLAAYATALADGRPRWVERDTAVGMVRELLDSLRQRKRRKFLDQRTVLVRGQRRLKIPSHRTLPVSDEHRAHVLTFMAEFAARQERPNFFAPIDVARRASGLGSLGLDRYVVLVEGNGSPNDNALLDLKQMVPSSLEPVLRWPQPPWPDPATRVISIQRRVQAISPAFLHAVTVEGRPFQLQELQPTRDQVRLQDSNGRLDRLEPVLSTMGQVVAWGHLRGSGRQGSASADALMGFARQERWRDALLDYARALALRIERDWRLYCQAFDDGAFD